jgi:hypothetical protein
LWTARLAKQAEIYHDTLSACFAEPVFSGVTFWGCSDRYTWVRSHYAGGDGDRPLLFDNGLRPKPAYFGVHRALARLAPLRGHLGNAGPAVAVGTAPPAAQRARVRFQDDMMGGGGGGGGDDGQPAWMA